MKKEDQRSGRETRGIVSRLLTNSAYHPRGIKVLLSKGSIVGRVTRIFGEIDSDVAVEPPAVEDEACRMRAEYIDGRADGS